MPGEATSGKGEIVSVAQSVPPGRDTLSRFSRSWFTRRVVVPLARAYGHYCRARVFGEDLIPRNGPVIYVGKHPRSYLYLETALLGVFAFWDSDRPPMRVLESAHATARRTPVLNWIRQRAGAVAATEENALEILEHHRESLLIFPGGTRELYGAPNELRWDGRHGYARIAIAAQVPVVPFAIAGADQQHPMRIAVRGSSIWLPPIPLPVPLDFHFGAPLLPPPVELSDESRDDVVAFADQVRSATEELLARGMACRRRL